MSERRRREGGGKRKGSGDWREKGRGGEKEGRTKGGAGRRGERYM